MTYIRNLQNVYNHVRSLLFKKLDVEHIGGRAGRLEDETMAKKDYRAIFIFDSENERKIGKLERFLKKESYGVGFIFGRYSIDNVPEDTKLWKIMLISGEGLPSQQEEVLIRALNKLKDILEKYK